MAGCVKLPPLPSTLLSLTVIGPRNDTSVQNISLGFRLSCQNITNNPLRSDQDIILATVSRLHGQPHWVGRLDGSDAGVLQSSSSVVL